MMFAVVGEELGLIGVTLVIMAFCAFGYAGIRLAIVSRDPFAKRLAAAIHNAKLAVIPRQGHYYLYADPVTTHRVIREFLMQSG